MKCAPAPLRAAKRNVFPLFAELKRREEAKLFISECDCIVSVGFPIELMKGNAMEAKNSSQRPFVRDKANKVPHSKRTHCELSE